MVLLSTVAVAVANRSRRSCVPAPVTTTTSRRSGSDASWKFCWTVAPAVTVMVALPARKPMRRAFILTCCPWARAPGTLKR